MRKLLTTLAIAISAVVLTAQAAAASTANTGSVGPAEEPSWILPAVGLFILAGIVAAVVSARHSSPE